MPIGSSSRSQNPTIAVVNLFDNSHLTPRSLEGDDSVLSVDSLKKLRNPSNLIEFLTCTVCTKPHSLIV